jgi:hypothetical protein
MIIINDLRVFNASEVHVGLSLTLTLKFPEYGFSLKMICFVNVCLFINAPLFLALY